MNNPKKLSDLVTEYYAEQAAKAEQPDEPLVDPSDYQDMLNQADVLIYELSKRITPPALWCETCFGRGTIAPNTYCTDPHCPASRKLRFDRLHKMMRDWNHIPDLYADYTFESWTKDVPAPIRNHKQLGEIMCRYFAHYAGNSFTFEQVMVSPIAHLVLPNIESVTIEEANWDNYDPYNDEPPYDKLNIVLNKDNGATTITRHNSEGIGLVLAGEKGVGKTGLSIATAYSLINKGKPVAYMHLPTFIREIKATYGTKGGVNHLTEPIVKADVLIIDEFGMPESQASQHNIGLVEDYIITPRWAQGKPMLITTNHTPASFEEHWGERLASRVFEKCHWVTLSGLVARRRNRPLG